MFKIRYSNVEMRKLKDIKNVHNACLSVKTISLSKLLLKSVSVCLTDISADEARQFLPFSEIRPLQTISDERDGGQTARV